MSGATVKAGKSRAKNNASLQNSSIATVKVPAKINISNAPIRQFVASPTGGPVFYSNNTITSLSSTVQTYNVWSAGTATTTGVPYVINHRDPKDFANVQFHQDAQDQYCDSIGRITIKNGYECKITLPDGNILQIGDDGRYALMEKDKDVKFIFEALTQDELDFFLTKFHRSIMASYFYGGPELDLPDGYSGVINLVDGTKLIFDNGVYKIESKQGILYETYFKQNIPIKIPTEANCDIVLPDGTILHCMGDGTYRIDDQNQTVIYKPAPEREFNKFINASDLLEQFVDFVGSLDVKKDEFLNLPIDLFIKWLIMRAAEQDGDPIPNDIVLEIPPQYSTRTQHQVKTPVLPKWESRCRNSGRFIKKSLVEKGIQFATKTDMIAFAEKFAW